MNSKHQNADNIARSIVIPCCNEADRLPRTLDSVLSYVDATGVPTEIVIVDDGSTDFTAEWAKAKAAGDDRIRVVSYSPNRGKGYAVKTGMLAAQGAYRLFMDADGATSIEHADAVWALLEGDRADVVIGSRYIEGAHMEYQQRLGRRLAGALFRALTRFLVLYGLKDTQCGFKGFTREASVNVFSGLRTTGALFDVEALLLAARRGLRIAEIPVTWHHNKDSRLTYTPRGSFSIFLELLRIKYRNRVAWPVNARNRN